MFSNRYHVIVFKEGTGKSRQLKLRGVALPFLALLLGGLLAGNVYFWYHVKDLDPAKQKLVAAQEEAREHKSQLVMLSRKLVTLERDLARIRDFNAKLRLLADLEPHSGKPSPGKNAKSKKGALPAEADGKLAKAEVRSAEVGGAEAREFSQQFRSLYRQEMLARQMSSFLDQLSTAARLEEAGQQELLVALRERRHIMLSTPSIWPTEGWVSSSFGYRRSPFTGRRQFHKGLDIACNLGTPVKATANGVVTRVGYMRGYGVMVVVDHGIGLATRYAHMRKSNVKKGQAVERGDVVGYSGSTGRSTGPHLHYEVRLNGLPVNPMRYILD